MTHLGLGSSFEEPWEGLLGGCGGGDAFLGGGAGHLGRLCWLVPGGATYYLAYLPWGVISLPCMGGARGLRGAISLPMWKERSSLGGIVFFP